MLELEHIRLMYRRECTWSRKVLTIRFSSSVGVSNILLIYSRSIDGKRRCSFTAWSSRMGLMYRSSMLELLFVYFASRTQYRHRLAGCPNLSGPCSGSGHIAPVRLIDIVYSLSDGVYIRRTEQLQNELCCVGYVHWHCDITALWMVNIYRTQHNIFHEGFIRFGRNTVAVSEPKVRRLVDMNQWLWLQMNVVHFTVMNQWMIFPDSGFTFGIPFVWTRREWWEFFV